ncbi:AAA domain-containing protein [Runella sp.]|uniref:AAA domain-containing protein n=1 Tax=Runella sp. TaxID=1960881 RepID=UPI002605AC3C|nr:AAA domain-containing protein [Runella sp.]
MSILSGINIDLLENQIHICKDAFQKYSAVAKLDWSKKALNDCQNGIAAKWNNRLKLTTIFLGKVKFEIQYREFEQKNRIIIPNNFTLQQLRSDADILLRYLISSNKSKVSFGIFDKFLLPPHIKEREYFTKTVFINGSPCDEIQEFNLVIRYFDFRIECENILNSWDNSLVYNDNLYAELEENLGVLDTIITQSGRYRIGEESISQLVKIKGLNEEVINEISLRIKYTRDVQIYKTAQQQLNILLTSLSNPQLHPITGLLRNAIEQQDWNTYQIQKDNLKQLNRQQQEWERYQKLIQTCQSIFPEFTELIVESRANSEQIDLLPKAIYWQVANSEFKKFLSQSEAELYENLKQEEKQIRDVTAKLAADKAWIEVLGRIDNDLSRKLTLWAMAMNKAHGKGKKALQNRKAAQALMTDCQQSVPCWIMPLPKLVETLQPEAAIYDYVIVDEASQLGPDAMFLMYLAKNIIIVGDDKQTAPQYVGVENDKVQDLINQYLKNIPYNSFFNIDYSFFDHANAFCSGQKVVLREHFRCMPEIIEFCNRHFYQSAGIGLHPLKQYDDNRLEPLKTVFVKGGYIEGQTNTIRNKPEADELVETIQACLNDKRYAGKTFGIIALQGQAQAQIINQKLLTVLDSQEFEKRKIICGDAKSFQGDERDIMFLSLVTATNHNRRALTTSEFERMFNVAVSRAVEQVWLFHSIQLEDLTNHDDLRYKLLSYFQNPLQPSITISKEIEGIPRPFDSQFEVDVYNEIVKREYTVTPQYSVSHYRIDLVVILPNGVKIAVECDGDKYHSTPEQIANDIARQKILERAGWQFFRVRGGDFYYNQEKALEQLWVLLERNCSTNDKMVKDFDNKTSLVSQQTKNFPQQTTLFEQIIPSGRIPNLNQPDIQEPKVNKDEKKIPKSEPINDVNQPKNSENINSLHLQLLSKRQTLLSKLQILLSRLPKGSPQRTILQNSQQELEKSLDKQKKFMQKDPSLRIAMQTQANKIIEIIETTDTLISTIKGEISKVALSELETAVGEIVGSTEEAEVHTERPITEDRDTDTGQQKVKNFILEKGISKSKWHPETFKHAFILVFTNYKRVYSIKNQNFRNAEDVLSNLTFEKDEKHIYCCGTTNFKGFMLFAFENGRILKVYLNAYQTYNQYLEEVYISTSNLCFISYIENDLDLLAHSKAENNQSKVFIFNTKLIIPSSWRGSTGIKLMSFEEKLGKLEGLKTLEKVNIKDKYYYLRNDIPQTGVFVRTNEGESL